MDPRHNQYNHSRRIGVWANHRSLRRLSLLRPRVHVVRSQAEQMATFVKAGRGKTCRTSPEDGGEPALARAGSGRLRTVPEQAAL